MEGHLEARRSEGRGKLRVAAKAGRQHTRANNLRLVLQQFVQGDRLSRADLARATGLNPATVSVLVSQLVHDRLIQPVEPTDDPASDARVGKPPTMLSLRADGRSIIGVDLSRPDVAAAVVFDLAGVEHHRSEAPLGDKTGDRAVALTGDLAAEAAAKAAAPILGIGIATPGIVTENTTVADNPKLGWTNVALAGAVAEAVAQADPTKAAPPTYIGNDANLAALAEYSRAAHDDTHLAAVKIGSGVGAGFILNGHPYEGLGFGAGEIGHLVVDPNGKLCHCGHRGCLETVLTAPLLRASKTGPAADRLGMALAPIVAILDLHEIVLAGPGDVITESFCHAVTESLRTRCLERVAETVLVRPSLLGDDVVLLGAMSLVLSQELGVA